jgi:acylphosphatase
MTAGPRTGGGETIVRIVARGRVQGVGYRAFTQSQAQARGIIGWVRNRHNGDVEAVLAGPADAVDAVCEICRKGPPRALVEALDREPADRSTLVSGGDALDSFLVLPTA